MSDRCSTVDVSLAMPPFLIAIALATALLSQGSVLSEQQRKEVDGSVFSGSFEREATAICA
jgi:lipopolysaccharide/colanic/teichoic acid biosynthesis glycosyltransferase